MNKPKQGDKVELLVHRWRGKVESSEWESSYIVESLEPAEDRPYRVTCSGQGCYFRECAPECVRIIP